jgi:hypothetical protein
MPFEGPEVSDQLVRIKVRINMLREEVRLLKIKGKKRETRLENDIEREIESLELRKKWCEQRLRPCNVQGGLSVVMTRRMVMGRTTTRGRMKTWTMRMRR